VKELSVGGPLLQNFNKRLNGARCVHESAFLILHFHFWNIYIILYLI
jgi:hypothetical protein